MNHGALWIIVGGSLILRLAVISPVHASGYTSDEREYLSMARTLLEHGVFVDSNGERAIRAPLYPGLAAGLLVAGGNSRVVLHIAGCLLGSFAVWLVYVLASIIGGDRRVALWAAGIAAVYPGLVIYSTLLQTESLYIVFVLLAFIQYYRMLDSPGIVPAVILGLCGGLAALTRAVYAGFLLVPVVLLLWHHRSQWRSLILLAALTLGVSVVTVAPWTIRNRAVLGEFVPVASGGGNALLTGNNPFATGTYRTEQGFEAWVTEQSRKRGVQDPSALSETAHSALNAGIALDYIGSHPEEVCALALRKSSIYWIYPITHSDSFLPLQAVAVSVDAIVAGLAVLGVGGMWVHRRRLSLVVAALLFFWLVQTVLHAEARFRLPVVPLLAIFAGCGSMLLARREHLVALGSQPWFKRGVVAGLFVVVLIYGATGVLFLRGAFSH